MGRRQYCLNVVSWPNLKSLHFEDSQVRDKCGDEAPGREKSQNDGDPLHHESLHSLRCDALLYLTC